MNVEPTKPDHKKPTDLRMRTRDYALRIIRLYSGLPKSAPAQVIGKQLLRSGTSVGAQYRETHRAKSDADFISKLESVLQELDESDFWLELLVESGIVSQDKINPLQNETSELIAIFVASVKHVKAKMNK
jgi:four helix bundle protein